uniref:RING-type domain-containing protein n=1 Tax=viral metagenome TaxID=1070528 RepID=A0A6C0D2N2_9ZZZZ
MFIQYIFDKILDKIDRYRHYFIVQKKEDLFKDQVDLCCICLDKMNPSCPTLFKCIVCLHSIHSHCIKKWYDIKHGIKVTCPLCRFPISLSIPMKKKYKREIYAFFLGFSIRLFVSFYFQVLSSTTTSLYPLSYPSSSYPSSNISDSMYTVYHPMYPIYPIYPIYNKGGFSCLPFHSNTTNN